MTAENLIKNYPVLFHMAERGSWPSIRRHGLLSTSALLDLHDVTGKRRELLEARHRPVSVPLTSPTLGTSVLRDQRPMPPSRLRACLPSRVRLSDWYRLLNGKVFFWTLRSRLITMLNARNYRGRLHDVLIIDTARLVTGHAASIQLCHINSGNTFPYIHKKSPSIFRSIDDYPMKRNGVPKPDVIEVTVEYAVPDVERLVVDVRSRTSKRDYGSLL